MSFITSPLRAAVLTAANRDPLLSGETPQRHFLIGDSLAARSFRVVSGAPVVSGQNVAIPMGTGAALPVPGSVAKIVNQTNTLLNREVPVIGSSGTSMIVQYPFAVDGLFSASVTAIVYGILNDTGFSNYIEARFAQLGKPLQMIRNVGEPGDTLTDILANVTAQLALYAREGDVVWLEGGVNGSGVGGSTSLDTSTMSDVLSLMEQTCEAILNLGVYLVATTVTQAQAAAYWATSPTVALANTYALNGLLERLARRNNRMLIADFHAALGGADYATAVPPTVETNGIHFLPAGAALCGLNGVAAAGDYIRKGTFYVPASVIDDYSGSASINLLQNSALAGATGTSAAPTNWTAGGTSNTFTSEPEDSSSMNRLRWNKASAGANQSTLTQDITARLVAGRRAIMGVGFETVSGDGAAGVGHYFNANVEFDIDGATYSYRLQNNQFSYASGGRIPPSGSRYFFELYGFRNLNGREGFLIPSGFSAARFVLRLQQGAAGACEVLIDSPTVYML